MKNLKLLGKLMLVGVMVAVLLTGCSLLPTASSSIFNALEDGSDTVTLPREEYDRLMQYASLDELRQMVEEYYYQTPDMDAMLEGAKRGLLAGLGDPSHLLLQRRGIRPDWEGRRRRVRGVGIQISASYITMMCTITRVFAGSPAEAAGLHKGDILARCGRP